MVALLLSLREEREGTTAEASTGEYPQSGFKWAVVSVTYYEHRRASPLGCELMGAIFKLDALQFIAKSAVEDVTSEAVSEATGDPPTPFTYHARI